jgi:5'(3')-deoxyribonucleotidase
MTDMKKQTIAVDVDDVLASSAQGWVDYSNQKWGTNLTVEEYQEDWSAMWKVDFEETMRRADHLHATGVVLTFKPYEEARDVLTELAKWYKLIVLTSRNSTARDDTFGWLNDHFGGIFDEIHLAGFYDVKEKAALQRTKAELLAGLGADYLIDDHPKHCLATAESGISTVLFGDYAWNRDIGKLPAGVTRCNDWAAVKEYFDGLSRS